MIEAELFDDAAANAIGSAVADVADPDAFGAQDNGRPGRAHAFKFSILLAARVNNGVGFVEGSLQGSAGAFLRVLGEDMWNVIDRDLGGQFADSVAPHAVGDQENVADLPPMLLIRGGHHGVGVLIVTAPNAHVGMASVLNFVESNHPYFLFSAQFALAAQRPPAVP